MSFFDFRSQKVPPTEATPIVPPPDFVSILIRKRAVFPKLTAASGHSGYLARQLDVTLMESGFKLSPALLTYISGCDSESALNAARTILAAARGHRRLAHFK